MAEAPEGELFSRLFRSLLEYEQELHERLLLGRSSAPAARHDTTPDSLEQSRKLARDIVAAIRTFRVPQHLNAIARSEYPELGGDDAFRAWYVEHPIGLLVEAYLAREAISDLPNSFQRLITLGAILHSGRLSHRATAYLDRMSRCFVLALDDEFAIMARSLLEVALADAVSDDEMKSLGFKPRRLGRTSIGFAFGDYLRAAESSGRLRPDQIDRLQAIRDAGNDAVHSAPGMHSGGMAMLYDIVDILVDLFPAKGD